MNSFDGICAWIYGGSQGIGRAIAEQLAGEGAWVMVLARNREALDDTVAAMEAVRKRPEQRFVGAVADVTDGAEMLNLAARQQVHFGRPDLVINCAGGAKPQRFGEISARQFDQTLALNLGGTRNVAASVTPFMTEGGVFLATASTAGLIGIYGYTDYCAAKFGVIGFCEALRAEMKPQGIRVSVLCPPDTDTPGFQLENTTKPAETAALSAGAGLATAQDMAKAALHGLRNQRFMIVPGLENRLVYMLSRRAPGLLRWYMDRVVARVQRGKAVEKFEDAEEPD